MQKKLIQRQNVQLQKTFMLYTSLRFQNKIICMYSNFYYTKKNPQMQHANNWPKQKRNNLTKKYLRATKKFCEPILLYIFLLDYTFLKHLKKAVNLNTWFANVLPQSSNKTKKIIPKNLSKLLPTKQRIVTNKTKYTKRKKSRQSTRLSNQTRKEYNFSSLSLREWRKQKFSNL